MTEPTPEFSRPISVTDVPRTGKHWIIEADGAECDALAVRYGIVGVQSLKAHLAVRPQGPGDIYKVEGTLEAEVTQLCVVSLTPVPERVEESFSLLFAPPTDEAAPDNSLDPLADDPPDPVVDGTIDLGEVAAEHLALSLNPFPRAPDAQLELPAVLQAQDEPQQNSPFSVLAEFREKKMQK